MHELSYLKLRLPVTGAAYRGHRLISWCGGPWQREAAG
jgi:hypothetical protein